MCLALVTEYSFSHPDNMGEGAVQVTLEHGPPKGNSV